MDEISFQSLIKNQPSIEIFENILRIGKKSIDIVGKYMYRFKINNVTYPFYKLGLLFTNIGFCYDGENL